MYFMRTKAMRRMIAIGMALTLALGLLPAALASDLETPYVETVDETQSRRTRGDGSGETSSPKQESIKLKMSLSSSESSAQVGKSYTLTATLSGLTVSTTGKVVFSDNGETIHSAPVSGSKVSVSWSPSYAGKHTLSAQFVPGADDPYTAASASCKVSVSQPARERSDYVITSSDSNTNSNNTHSGISAGRSSSDDQNVQPISAPGEATDQDNSTPTTPNAQQPITGGDVSGGQQSNGSRENRPSTPSGNTDNNGVTINTIDPQNDADNTGSVIAGMIDALTQQANQQGGDSQQPGSQPSGDLQPGYVDNTGIVNPGTVIDPNNITDTDDTGNLIDPGVVVVNPPENIIDGQTGIPGDVPTTDDGQGNENGTDGQNNTGFFANLFSSLFGGTSNQDETMNTLGADGRDPAPAPTIGISLSPNPPEINEACTITATVSAPGVNAASATGSFEFFADGSSLGSVPVVNGSATMVVTPLEARPHVLLVKYTAGANDVFADNSKQENITAVDPDAPVPFTDIGTCTITVADAVYGAIPAVTVVTAPGGVTLQKDIDYQVALNGGSNVPSGSVTITGIGAYTGTKVEKFTVTAKQLPASAIAPVADQPHTGNPIEPGVSITDGSTTFLNGTDYYLTYSDDHTNVGEVTITIHWQNGNYTLASNTVKFKIVDATPLSSFTVQFTNPDAMFNGMSYYYYTGNDITPAFTVAKPGNTLRAGTDYTYAFTSNKGLGPATLTITGITYAGTLTANFIIVPRQGDFTVMLPQSVFDYTGSAIEPQPIVMKNGITLQKGRDYDLSYSNNTFVGTATVTVTGKGAYSGSVSQNFTIQQAYTQLTLTSTRIGNNLKVIAKVTGGRPSGNVRFTVIGSSTRSYDAPIGADGTASITIDDSTRGNFTVKAQYLGDNNHRSSNEASITPNSSRVRLSVTGGEYGGTAYLTAEVLSNGQYRPTGQVEFWARGELLARVNLGWDGYASFTWKNVPNYEVEILAIYLGDSYYPRMTSNTVVLNRTDDSDRRMPTILFTATGGKGKEPVKLTAILSSGSRYWSEVPTGEVLFYNGTTYIGSARIRWGEATFYWQDVPSGSYTLNAEYRGDNLYRKVYATTTYKKSSSSSSSGSGTSSGGSSVTPTQVSTQTGVNSVVLRDAGASMIATYDTGVLPVQNGVITLDTSRSMEFYSYSFPISRLRTLDSQYDGYFRIVAPDFNCLLPFDVVNGVQGLTQYIQSSNLKESQLELRLNIRKITDSTLASAFAAANPGSSTASSFYRVELALYDASGVKLGFTPGTFDYPIRLLVPATRQSGIAQRYDEASGSFTPATLEFSDNTAILQIDRGGIYVVATDSYSDAK